MRRLFLILAALIFLHVHAQARILTIGPGGYAGLSAAAADALPGDTLMFTAGTHAGGAHVANLQGTAEQWITIMGDPSGTTLIEGGSNAFQLSEVAYLRISGLEFDGQTGNGVNIDDGGSFDTPVHDLVIEYCRWRGIGATGNNDQLKMSGVDDFVVRNCDFRNGSPGGSMIDMVGCHYGRFENNRFENGGSNCIQAKGGTHNILITRNRFYRGGQRAINIGGSTGLAYFRPQDADYEAKNIMVWANVFTGAMAPIAFVGAVRCAVLQNTIYLPEKWAVRILQENIDTRFLQCGENLFQNNIVIVDDRADAPTFNIGPNTRPETFLFTNNLWYHIGNSSWGGPNTPTTEQNGIIGQDPLLMAAAVIDGDFRLRRNSPAIRAGVVTETLPDFLGQQFNDPPSIGAIEGDPPTSSVNNSHPTAAEVFDLQVYPNPGTAITFHIYVSHPMPARLELYDLVGKRRYSHNVSLIPGVTLHHWSAPTDVVAGVYAAILTTPFGRRTVKLYIGM